MTPEQQIREAFEELYLRATEKQAWLEELRDAHEAALDRLVAERDEARRVTHEDARLVAHLGARADAAEKREAYLREALAEVAGLVHEDGDGTFAEIQAVVAAALAGVPADDPTPPEGSGSAQEFRYRLRPAHRAMFDAFVAGFNHSAEGWNGEHPFDNDEARIAASVEGAFRVFMAAWLARVGEPEPATGEPIDEREERLTRESGLALIEDAKRWQRAYDRLVAERDAEAGLAERARVERKEAIQTAWLANDRADAAEGREAALREAAAPIADADDPLVVMPEAWRARLRATLAAVPAADPPHDKAVT